MHHTCDQTTTPLPVRLSTLELFLNGSIEDAVLSWIVASATVPLLSFRAIHLTPSSVTQLHRLAPTILGSLRHLAVDYPHDSAWQQIPPLYKPLESLTFSGIDALSFAGMSHPTLRHMVVSFDIPFRTTHPVFSISDLTVSKFPNLRRIDLPETLAYELESADGRTFLAECKPLVVTYKDGFVLEVRSLPFISMGFCFPGVVSLRFSLSRDLWLGVPNSPP